MIIKLESLTEPLKSNKQHDKPKKERNEVGKQGKTHRAEGPKKGLWQICQLIHRLLMCWLPLLLC